MSANTSLFSSSFLLSCWAQDYANYCNNGEDERLFTVLKNWADKGFQKEAASEGGFIQAFFISLWGYRRSGEQEKSSGYTLEQQFAINKAGQNGGSGKADAALGWFGSTELPPTPQVLCEFKDIRSGLEAKQNRKGNDRSPVQQCADYLYFARQQFTPHGTEKIQPTWGIVTDMNEFRLYLNTRMPHQYERFVIRRNSLGDAGVFLLDTSESAKKQRFIFSRIFHAEQLLNRGTDAALSRLLSQQRIQEKSLEKTFYFEYRAYRDELFQVLLQHNRAARIAPRQMVRLTQKLLDRLLFVMFCEDMGAHLQFPVNLLRDLLIKDSQDTELKAEGVDFWEEKVLRLFKAMRNGGDFRTHAIGRFNGGLFAADPELDDLYVPNKVFFSSFQGASETELLKHKKTLLYFAANYNFGLDDGGERAIGLYTLGRIFEQSITDLEIMEAEAAQEDSLMKLSKRKTDGVYYTPEWVTAYIVEETLGLRLRELRVANGHDEFTGLDGVSIDEDHFKNGKLKKNSSSARYSDWLDTYQERLSHLKVLDPACGSGAFLIQALKRLLQEHEWVVAEKSRVNYEYRQVAVFDKAKAYREILAKNLYGVDVNAESVEITKLALWLHTVMPGQPLSSLDSNILCGNSLVAWDIETILGQLTEEQKQRINPFSYEQAFAEVFAVGGFDVIIGNPPYIKLQNMRRIQPEATDYWVQAKAANGDLKFRSTQTGNYDIYLPFIEQSLRLLNPEGRMGFIAPNVWAVNDYGQGLREVLHETRRMDRWVDFKSFQIFDEAITYTALQFFTGQAVDGIKLHFAPNGGDDLSSLDWSQIKPLPYENLPAVDAWQFMPEAERLLLQSLATNHSRLDNYPNIIVGFRGVETGADNLFHFYRVSEGLYRYSKGQGSDDVFEFEDDIMKPLASGIDAARYVYPKPSVYVLFPFVVENNKPRLCTVTEMQSQYPKAWRYFKKMEKIMREREYGYMNKDDRWWGYNRPMNLEKMSWAKLGIAQTVTKMAVFYENKGECYFNNVRVGGIHVSSNQDMWFLMGVLNAPVVNYVFRRISKAKEGGYYEANKQFIAPLPIPNADEEQKKQVAELAEKLQELHTAYRDELQKLEKRLNAAQMIDAAKTPQWIWSSLLDEKQWKASDAAKATELKGKALTDWVKAQYQTDLAKKLEKLTVNLTPNTQLTVRYDDGELSLLVNGTPAFDSVFEDDAELIAVQWKYVIRSTNITPSVTAEKLLGELLKLKTTENDSLHKQIIALDKKLDDLQLAIDSKEREMNALVYGLYGLSKEEILQIERG